MISVAIVVIFRSPYPRGRFDTWWYVLILNDGDFLIFLNLVLFLRSLLELLT